MILHRVDQGDREKLWRLSPAAPAADIYIATPFCLEKTAIEGTESLWPHLCRESDRIHEAMTMYVCVAALAQQTAVPPTHRVLSPPMEPTDLPCTQAACFGSVLHVPFRSRPVTSGVGNAEEKSET